MGLHLYKLQPSHDHSLPFAHELLETIETERRSSYLIYPMHTALMKLFLWDVKSKRKGKRVMLLVFGVSWSVNRQPDSNNISIPFDLFWSLKPISIHRSATFYLGHYGFVNALILKHCSCSFIGLLSYFCNSFLSVSAFLCFLSVCFEVPGVLEEFANMMWQGNKSEKDGVEVFVNSDGVSPLESTGRTWSDGPSEKEPAMITSTWRIGWQTPTLMVSCYVLGMPNFTQLLTSLILSNQLL